jgi:hypothetical protein
MPIGRGIYVDEDDPNGAGQGTGGKVAKADPEPATDDPAATNGDESTPPGAQEPPD